MKLKYRFAKNQLFIMPNTVTSMYKYWLFNDIYDTTQLAYTWMASRQYFVCSISGTMLLV